ncbi:hypothetical protein, partial [Salmonella sp. SAL4437]|uniref:hypothetical protein n=1 Tax=Salmonella sp. SAL4437 TaxID=3159892 RepID=UPI00397A84C2
LGWWGFISFFVTPLVLLNNIGRYLLCLGMAPPARPGTWVGARGRPGPRDLGQLVGQNCVRCGGRIPSTFDGRFCQECHSPVHHECARP